MPTVSAVHENKLGRKKLSVGKNPKAVTRERRETIIPTYQDVVESNLADEELHNNNLGVV